MLQHLNLFVSFCLKSIKDGGKDGLLEVVSAEHSKLSAMVLELTETDDDIRPTRSSTLPNARGENKRKGIQYILFFKDKFVVSINNYSAFFYL